MCVFHIFLTQLSVDGHLGCFHVIMAVVNSAAMNIGMHVSFELVFSFFPDTDPRVELLDHVVVLFLVF